MCVCKNMCLTNPERVVEYGVKFQEKEHYSSIILVFLNDRNFDQFILYVYKKIEGKRSVAALCRPRGKAINRNYISTQHGMIDFFSHDFLYCRRRK